MNAAFLITSILTLLVLFLDIVPAILALTGAGKESKELLLTAGGVHICLLFVVWLFAILNIISIFAIDLTAPLRLVYVLGDLCAIGCSMLGGALLIVTAFLLRHKLGKLFAIICTACFGAAVLAELFSLLLCFIQVFYMFVIDGDYSSPQSLLSFFSIALLAATSALLAFAAFRLWRRLAKQSNAEAKDNTPAEAPVTSPAPAEAAADEACMHFAQRIRCFLPIHSRSTPHKRSLPRAKTPTTASKRTASPFSSS